MIPYITDYVFSDITEQQADQIRLYLQQRFTSVTVTVDTPNVFISVTSISPNSGVVCKTMHDAAVYTWRTITNLVRSINPQSELLDYA